jgi:hypothetical protein
VPARRWRSDRPSAKAKGGGEDCECSDADRAKPPATRLSVRQGIAFLELLAVRVKVEDLNEVISRFAQKLHAVPIVHRKPAGLR